MQDREHPRYSEDRERDSSADGQSGGTAVARSPLLRGVYLIIGSLCTALAMVGVVMRGLPTTPFLLLAAAAFMRSSPRLHRRLLTSRRLGPHIRNFQEGRGIPLKVKIFSLVFAWSVMLSLALWVAPSPALRALFIGLAVTKTLFMLYIPTAPGAQQGAHRDRRGGGGSA